MERTKQLTVVQRGLLMDLVNQGKSYRSIQQETGIHFSTIASLVKKVKLHKTIEDLPGRGRKQKTTERENRLICSLIEQDRFTSAPELSKHLKETLNVDLSPSTVIRRLNSAGYNGRRPSKKPFLTPRHMKARLEWAKKYRNLPLSFWQKVLFHDESKYNLVASDGNKTVWRKPGEKYKLACMRGTVKFGGGNVMVWGAMAWNGAGKLAFIDDIMNAEIYVDILKKNLKPSTRKLRLGQQFIFQQDNDPKHTSRLAKQFFIENGVELLDWPAQSPDLNPIEHLWAIVERKIGARRCKNRVS